MFTQRVKPTSEGVPSLTSSFGVDSLDVFVLTGLTLNLTGRVRRNLYCRLEPDSHFILRCMHVMI